MPVLFLLSVFRFAPFWLRVLVPKIINSIIVFVVVPMIYVVLGPLAGNVKNGEMMRVIIAPKNANYPITFIVNASGEHAEMGVALRNLVKKLACGGIVTQDLAEIFASVVSVNGRRRHYADIGEAPVFVVPVQPKKVFLWPASVNHAEDDTTD